MLSKRIIPCLDVRAGKVTKGVAFANNVDVGDPVTMARYYYEQGADEIVFYDITASNERRGIMLDVVTRVARELFIPFTVGGGLRTLDDLRAVLLAGAEKVSIDSGAVRNPRLISEGANAFGSQCIVLSMQVARRQVSSQLPSGYEVVIDGGRLPTGLDAVEWARRGEALGAGELCVNSIDRDGTNLGYELELTRQVADTVAVPVIASGGAGAPEHLLAVFNEAGADAAIVASIIHYGHFSLPELKQFLKQNGVEVREPFWPQGSSP
jgi:cyclase